jgi:hypothetical protein
MACCLMFLFLRPHPSDTHLTDVGVVKVGTLLGTSQRVLLSKHVVNIACIPAECKYVVPAPKEKWDWQHGDA